jgi:hypothetical protein
MKHDSSTFLSGCAASHGFFFFAKELDELTKKDQANSSFFRYKESDADAQFRKYDESVGWPAISMITCKPENSTRIVVAIGPNGDYWELEPASTVETVGAIAGFRGDLRNLTVIDDEIYACGMGRVALHRQAPGKWQAIGPKPMKTDPEVIGFEDIGGYEEKEMYAVGWGGEIWWRDAGKWKRIDSPTSTNLRALCCTDDGVYVVGHDGTMIRGRRDSWEVIETQRKENLMDVAEYDGQIYVCTDFRLLKLTSDGLVNETNFEDKMDQPSTCLYLLKTTDGLISIGQKDVFRQQNAAWNRLV